jgi:hypothetical protein
MIQKPVIILSALVIEKLRGQYNYRLVEERCQIFISGVTAD